MELGCFGLLMGAQNERDALASRTQTTRALETMAEEKIDDAIVPLHMIRDMATLLTRYVIWILN